jgi:hypothetical protein
MIVELDYFKLWTPIIAAISAIIVSIISLITARATQRKSLEASLDMEKFKFELEHKKNIMLIQTEQQKSQIVAIDFFISSIQIIKDKLSQLINCRPESLLWESAFNSLNKSVNNYVEGFEIYNSNLNADLYKIIHPRKNAAMQIISIIEELYKKSIYVSLDEKEIKILTGLKESLNDLQNELRDKKYSLFTI